MKIGLIQIGANNIVERNKTKTFKFLNKAIKKGCDIVCLPEIFLYFGKGDYPLKTNDSLIKEFCSFAKENNIAIILGTITILNKDKTKSNACFVIDKQGKIVTRYDKIHMYKTLRKDFYYDESKFIKPGTDIGLFELEGVKMGVAICFDLRFPELFRDLTREGAKIIFLPSCFHRTSGWKAWSYLPEARAIENQVYFCACSQTGTRGVQRKCGNSRIIDFKGKTLTRLKNREGLIISEIDLEAQKNYRKIMPVLD